MKSRKRKKKYTFCNFVAIIILFLFIVLELLYNNIIMKNNFRSTIDNLPINTFLFFNDYIKGNQKSNFDINIPQDSSSEFIDETIQNNTSINEENTVDDISTDVSNQDSNVNTDFILENTNITESDEIIELSNDYVPITSKKLKYKTVLLDYFVN